MVPLANPRAKAGVAAARTAEQKLDELATRGRAVLARLTDQEVEAIIWVVIQTIREVERSRRGKRSSSRRKSAGPAAPAARRARRSAVVERSRRRASR